MSHLRRAVAGALAGGGPLGAAVPRGIAAHPRCPGPHRAPLGLGRFPCLTRFPCLLLLLLLLWPLWRLRRRLCLPQTAPRLRGRRLLRRQLLGGRLLAGAAPAGRRLPFRRRGLRRNRAQTRRCGGGGSSGEALTFQAVPLLPLGACAKFQLDRACLSMMDCCLHMPARMMCDQAVPPDI